MQLHFHKNNYALHMQFLELNYISMTKITTGLNSLERVAVKLKPDLHSSQEPTGHSFAYFFNQWSRFGSLKSAIVGIFRQLRSADIKPTLRTDC